MRRRIRSAALIVTAAVGLLTLLQRGAVGQVGVNEIMYNPTQGNDYDYEWVELYNAGGEYTFGASVIFNDGGTFTGLQGTTMSAGGYLVLSGNKSAFQTAYPGVSSSQVLEYNAMALNNDGDTVYIDADGDPGTTGDRLDSVTYSKTWGANGTDASLERRDWASNSNDARNWAASAAQYGTPAAQNSVVPEPATCTLFGLGALFLAAVRSKRIALRAKGDGMGVPIGGQ